MEIKHATSEEERTERKLAQWFRDYVRTNNQPTVAYLRIARAKAKLAGVEWKCEQAGMSPGGNRTVSDS